MQAIFSACLIAIILGINIALSSVQSTSQVILLSSLQ